MSFIVGLVLGAILTDLLTNGEEAITRKILAAIVSKFTS